MLQLLPLHTINVFMLQLLLHFLILLGSQFPSTPNTLRPRQHGRHFADDTFKRIFLNENVRIPIEISLKFVHKGPINNIPALVQIMACRRPGDKPLSEPMLVGSLTHICVTRPQWANSDLNDINNDNQATKSRNKMICVFHNISFINIQPVISYNDNVQALWYVHDAN